jgi:hypothetical protein
MKLFGRFVQAIIVTNDKELIINEIENNRDDDIKITFKIEKSKFKNPNTGTIEIYNLNKSTRDMLSNSNMTLTLNAGYEDGYETLINCDVSNVWHKFQGLDWVSTFEVAEGIVKIKESNTNKAFKKDEKLSDVIGTVAKDMKLEFDGLLEDITLKSKEILSGNSATVLDDTLKSYDMQYHISDNKVKIFSTKLKRKEAIVLSSSSGLLKDNGVVKTEIGVNLKSMLIPTINAGDTIYLDAAYISDTKVKTIGVIKEDMTLESMNGYYIVSVAKFQGDNKDGSYTVEVECLNGT